MEETVYEEFLITTHSFNAVHIYVPFGMNQFLYNESFMYNKDFIFFRLL